MIVLDLLSVQSGHDEDDGMAFFNTMEDDGLVEDPGFDAGEGLNVAYDALAFLQVW